MGEILNNLQYILQGALNLIKINQPLITIMEEKNPIACTYNDLFGE